MISQELLESLAKVHGNVMPLLLPDGDWVVIREQNGQDDAILSKAKDATNGIALSKFLASIIIHHSAYPDIKVTEAQTLKMKVRSRFYILVASRIFSLGSTVSFDYKWSDMKTPTKYEEDMTTFVPDLGKPLPKPGDDDYNPCAILPYKEASPSHEFEISTGKIFKFYYANGESEKYLMEVDSSEKTVNHEYTARNLSELIDGAWVKIQTFQRYTAREMAEIRKQVRDWDPEIDLYTEISHPEDSSVRVKFQLILTPDFFFPLGI